MKPEINSNYIAALFICAAVIWLVGPLFMSFLFDAVLIPAPPGKYVPLAQVKATWNDTLKFLGAMGWIFTLGDFAVRGRPIFQCRTRGRSAK